MNVETISKSKILSIEAVRGFAAIYVLIGHIVLLYQPQNFIPKIGVVLKTTFSFGHQAVILFFIVSGFSIHYSSLLKKRDLQKYKKDYFFARWKRLYPLFFICLLLSLFVLNITQLPSSSWRNFLSFFFLTDTSVGSITEPIPTNFPIWSLSYEVLYYLIYPVLWVFISKFNIQKIFKLSIFISLLAGWISTFVYPNHLTNVFQYFWTWVAGAWIAEMKLKNTKVSPKYLKGSIVFCMALMLTLENVFLIRDWFWALFFVLIFMSFFSEKQETKKSDVLINFGIGSLGILIAFLITDIESAVFHPLLLKYMLVGILLFLVLALLIPLVIIQNLLRNALKPFVTLGAFSYALYIFHWPLIVLFKYFFMNWAQLGLLHMFVIIVFNTLVIFILSWLLEIKLQPKISTLLSKLYAKI